MAKFKIKNLGKIFAIIAGIGALNWGLAVWANLNLVTAIFGTGGMFSSLVYTIIGVSGAYLLLSQFFPKMLKK